MRTWCLVTLSFVLFSALFFDTCNSAAFSEETASKLKRTYNEETKGFGKAALNDRQENDNWVGEYNENDVDDHDSANDEDDAANKDENDEDQSDIENKEGGKYEDEEQDTIEEEDEYEIEGKELSDLLQDDYDNEDDDDYYDDDDADDLSDKSDLAEWDEDDDEEGRFFSFFFNQVYYKGQEDQARIHTGFHRFTEIGQVFHNKHIFNNNNSRNFQVEIWKMVCTNFFSFQFPGIRQKPGKGNFRELKPKKIPGGASGLS